MPLYLALATPFPFPLFLHSVHLYFSIPFPISPLPISTVSPLFHLLIILLFIPLPSFLYSTYISLYQVYTMSVIFLLLNLIKNTLLSVKSKTYSTYDEDLKVLAEENGVDIDELKSKVCFHVDFT